MKKKIATVTPDERDAIQKLFERRNGLTELSKIVTVDNAELYEKVVADLGATSTRFQNWWSGMAAKYNWESAPNGNWEIDFDTCDIYLVTNE